MTDNTPTLKPKQMAFFSDWVVEVRWPDGQKEKVSGFTTEAHALGWIEHESPGWLAMNQKSYRPRSAAPAAPPSGEIKVGDVVKLKSGGPNMTVNGVAPDGNGLACVQVAWFDDKNAMIEGGFPAASVELVR